MKNIVLFFFFIVVTLNVKADIILDENFTAGVLPLGWTNTAIQGSDIWVFRNSPAFGSQSGGGYAVFDDNLLGASVIPNESALTTPSVDCSNRTNVFLSYSHHWFGVEFTHGFVEISNNGGTVWTQLIDYHKVTKGSLAASQDTIFDITAYAANQSDVKVRFRYTDGSQAGKWWYLDDVRIYSDPDVGITNLNIPDYLGCAQTYSNAETVTVEITNYGVNPITNIPITCEVSGGTASILTGTYTGAPILEGQTATFTFSTTIDMSVDAVYDFYIYTQLVTDTYLNNDTLYTSRQQLVVTYPYFQNFNNTTAGWYATGSNPPINGERNFSHGNIPYLNGPQGNGDSWFVETNLSIDGSYIWVESPVFDFTTLVSPVLTLDIKHQLYSSDYFRVEYSTNGGTTWSILGNGSDPNWYNSTNRWTNSYNNPVDNWESVQHSLCNLAGQSCVKFRLYGRPYYGFPNYPDWYKFAFDNVQISEGNDVGIVAYVDPVDVGCLFNANQQVTVTVYNFSCNPVSNVPITCDITGMLATTLTGNIPGPIPAGGTVDYTFSTTINMLALGIYNFNSYTQLPSDSNISNDTLATSINVNNQKISTFPYSEDFNSGPGFWNASGSNPPANGGRNFVLGNIPYLNGPQGNGDSWYVETTTSVDGSYIWIESPVFDFTTLTNPTMTFDIKHSLYSSDYFRVTYSIDGGLTWSTLGSGPSPTWYNNTNRWTNSYNAQVDAWTPMSQELCDLSGEPCVKFRFYGRPYYGEPNYVGWHYFTMDNFQISATEPDDIQPVEIILSSSGTCSAFGVETISVIIQNNTCRPLFDVPVDLQLDGGAILSEIMPGPIPKYGTYIYTFTNTLNLAPPGIHNISVTTNLATDNIPSNDNLIENRYSSVPINTFPYTENFETNNGGWVSRTTHSSRFFNLDTLPYLNGPQGNGSSWFTETNVSINGTYFWVESPIFDLTAVTNPILTMDIKHQLYSSDFFRVEYSTNGGTSWTILGSGSDPNWYNSSNRWTNSYTNPVDQWQKVQHDLCAVAGQGCVKLRVYGRAYYGNPNYSDWYKFAFDNIEIKDGPDVGVIAYITPLDEGCLFDSTQQVTVEVYNYSCTPISNVPITCDITGVLTTTLTGTVPGPIPPGSSVNYTFPTSVNMVQLGIFNFNTYTQLAGDINPYNDALATSINVNLLKISTFPYSEDFNTGAGFWTAGGSNPPTNGGRNFILGNVPYLNGPQGNGDSWYVETTTSIDGSYIWVESPVFDFTNLTNPTMTFDIKHSLYSSDYFRVTYSIDGGSTWATLGSGPSPTWYNNTNRWTSSYNAQVDAWTPMSQELCDLSGEPCVKFRFYGRPYYGEPNYVGRHYFAMDNFQISGSDPDDIQPIEIILSSSGTCGAFGNETISVLIQNNTCRPVSNVPIDLQLDGGAILSEVMPGPIPRFGTYIYTFTNTLNLAPAGIHNISVTTNLVTDNVPANDNLVENRYSSVPINTFPYAENFDANNGGWVSRTTNNSRYFHWDTLPYLNGPQGNGKSWFTETNTSINGTYFWVESPVFDFTALTNPVLNLDIKHQLYGSDFFRVEYSINGGTSWTILGSGADPNWYNSSNRWTNTYNNPVDEWLAVQHNLCNVAGEGCVKFRIYGRAYYGNPNYPDWYKFGFDNVEIKEGNDVGVIAFVEPVDAGCLFSNTQQVTVSVYNFSCNAVTNIPITCDISGILNTTLSGTVVGPIPAGSSIDYTFPTTIDMTPIGTYDLVSYTTEPTDFNQSNDTSSVSINVDQITISTYPYYEDFNSGANYWLAGGSNPPTNGGRNFVLGNLPYLNGPQGYGDSWYVETTTSVNGSYIWVESPVFDFTGLSNPQMFFDIKHSLYASDYFRVTYSTNGGTTWQTLGSGPSATWYNNTNRWTNSYQSPVDQWKEMKYDLCNLIGEPCVKFRFYGRPYYGEPNYVGWHYFSFDNFHITDTPLDAAIDIVVGCYGSEYQIDVTINNIDLPCTGSPTINDLDLVYSIDGSAPTTVNYSGLNIVGGGNETISITGQTVPSDNSTIDVWVNFPNGFPDQVFENDTAHALAVNWPNCNDHCSNAIELGLGTTTATQNSNATVDPAEDPLFSGCGLITVENTVWYQFTTNTSGDSVTVIFDQQLCTPSQNGIQVSIDSVGLACDFTTYSNVYCSAQNDTTAFQYGPLPLPPNTTYYIAVDGFAGSDCDFDITIIGAVDYILPIDLLSFTANCGENQGSIDIKWITASENNNDYFTLEESRDGITFETIAIINGQGSSQNENNYLFTDNILHNGYNYYRLKQTDFNGTTKTFKTIKTNCDNIDDITVYPNPAQNSFIISGDLNIEKGQVILEITNTLGDIILHKNLQLDSSFLKETINSSSFADGIYYISIKTNDHNLTKKLSIAK